MNDETRPPYPAPLELALDRKVQELAFGGLAWELKIEGRDSYIERHAGCSVLVFANNGMGDSLFLKQKPERGEYRREVFEFFHEGPEIRELDEGLETILGLADRPPSAALVPLYDSQEDVRLGDVVERKGLFRRRRGTIVYVPGVSKRDPGLEFDGIRQALIRYPGKGDYTILVDPETNVLCGKIRLLARAPTRAR